MRKRALLSLVALLGANCDVLGIGGPKVRVDVVSRYSGGRPFSVRAVAEGIGIEGGADLTAGIAKASGDVWVGEGGVVTVLIQLDPDCCFNEAVSGEYRALVSNLAGGWHDVEVRQRYWRDMPDRTVVTRLFIPD